MKGFSGGCAGPGTEWATGEATGGLRSRDCILSEAKAQCAATEQRGVFKKDSVQVT